MKFETKRWQIPLCVCVCVSSAHALPSTIHHQYRQSQAMHSSTQISIPPTHHTIWASNTHSLYCLWRTDNNDVSILFTSRDPAYNTRSSSHRANIMEISSLINGKTGFYLEEQSAWDCSASMLTSLITPADVLETKISFSRVPFCTAIHL